MRASGVVMVIKGFFFAQIISVVAVEVKLRFINGLHVQVRRTLGKGKARGC